MAVKKIQLKVLKGFNDKQTGEYVSPDSVISVTQTRLKEMKEHELFSEHLEIIEGD